VFAKAHPTFLFFLRIVWLTALLHAAATNPCAGTQPGSRAEAVRSSINRATAALMARQRANGSWAGEVIMAARHTAYYILASNHTGYFDQPYYQRSLEWLKSSQQPDGTWGVSALTPTASSIPNTAVSALALEVAGVPKDDPKLVAAKRYIASHGGVDALDPLTQTMYALFGRNSWDSDALKQFDVTALLVPNDSPASLRRRPAWWREAYVPVSTLRALHSTKELSLAEKQGLRKAEEWMLSHQLSDGAWFTGIPTTFGVMAVHDLDPEKYRGKMEDGFMFLRSLKLPNGYQRPFELSVWDTSIAVVALRSAGMSACDPDLQRTIEWMNSAQTPGGLEMSEAAPGGWSYNPGGLIYPDGDDTSFGLWAMSRLMARSSHSEYRRRASVQRATEWVLYMQGDDGGWATFIQDDNKENDTKLPTGIEDPSIPDITGHALSGLGAAGFKASDERIRQAIEYLQRSQTAEGSWYGRWGLSYLYGTAAVLVGLHDVEADMQTPFVRKAADWLIRSQNADGGWGEAFNGWDAARGISYTELTRTSTAEQTAWAVMGLLTDDRPEAREAVERGVDYLLNTQRPEGDWQPGAYTVLGIDPYTNTLYATHWPLMALGYYQRATGQQTEPDCSSFALGHQGLPDPLTAGPSIGGAANLTLSLTAENDGRARLWVENKGHYEIHKLNFSLTPEGSTGASAQTWTKEKLGPGSRQSWPVSVPYRGASLWKVQLTYEDINGRTQQLSRELRLEGHAGWTPLGRWLKWLFSLLVFAGVVLAVVLGLGSYRLLLALGFRNLLQHRMRTALTSAGVILGTAAIGATLTLTLAFRAKLVQDFATFGTNRVIVLPYQVEIKFGPPANTLRRPPASRFHDEDVSGIKNLPQVSGVSPYEQEELPVTFSGQSLLMTLKFVDPETYPEVAASKIESGRFLSEEQKREVVLGYAAARDAFEKPVEVGDTIGIDGNDFNVVGVMEEVGGIRGRQGAIVSPDITLYAPLDAATEFTGRNYYDGIEVRAESASVTESVAERVEDLIKRAHLTSEFGVVSSQRLLDQVEKLLSQFTAIVVTISLLTLIVSGVGVANMMLIGVKERIAEIGIMKAIGARDRTVLIIFLSEAAGIGLLSAGVGCALGFVLLLLLQYFAGVAALPVAPYLLFFSLLFSLLITVVCGSYPAYVAARLAPVEAIRRG
jgi:squalene-hopene/tetraprenyl-beta-curcumene cyclase